jgi:hypothetical protein
MIILPIKSDRDLALLLALRLEMSINIQVTTLFIYLYTENSRYKSHLWGVGKSESELDCPSYTV